jgi:hypothetical protein
MDETTLAAAALSLDVLASQEGLSPFAGRSQAPTSPHARLLSSGGADGTGSSGTGAYGCSSPSPSASGLCLPPAGVGAMRSSRAHEGRGGLSRSPRRLRAEQKMSQLLDRDTLQGLATSLREHTPLIVPDLTPGRTPSRTPDESPPSDRRDLQL